MSDWKSSLEYLLHRYPWEVYMIFLDDKVMGLFPAYPNIDFGSEAGELEHYIGWVARYLAGWEIPYKHVRIERHSLVPECGDFRVGEIVWESEVGEDYSIDERMPAPKPVFGKKEIPWKRALEANEERLRAWREERLQSR